MGYADSWDGESGGHGSHVCGSVAGLPYAGSSASMVLSKGMAYNAKVRRVCV